MIVDRRKSDKCIDCAYCHLLDADIPRDPAYRNIPDAYCYKYVYLVHHDFCCADFARRCTDVY